MEPKSLRELFNNFMKYGAYLGVIHIVGFLLYSFFINPQHTSLFTIAFLYLLFSSLPWVLGLYFFTKAYRNQFLGGYISMPQILQFSAYVGLFSGLIEVLFKMVFVRFISPNFYVDLINNLSVQYIAMLEAAKSTQSDIDRTVLMFSQMKEALSQGITVYEALMAPFQSAFLAMLVMLVIGWKLRKLPPLFPDNLQE